MRVTESGKVLQAAEFFKDDVFIRTCDLTDAHSIFSADIMYHGSCLASYIRRFERELEQSRTPTQASGTTKEQVFDQISKEIQKGITDGLGYTLSDIRKMLNSQSTKTFNNRDLKRLLLNRFGDTITFTNPVENNKPAIVFSSKLMTEDVAEVIRTHDPIKECANVLRQSIKNLDYELSDKFCDSSDLADSWCNKTIPPAFSEFFCSLLNIDKSEIDDDVRNKEEEGKTASSNWVLKAHSLLQIIYYMMHRGKRKLLFT